MPVIGHFRADADGYSGTIRTLAFKAKVRILAYDRKGVDGKPDYRIFIGETEIGAAWSATAKETDAPYLRVRLDDPSLPEPIQAALMQAAADGVHRLLWRRPKSTQLSPDA
jgi:uncharacterized protein (DUF736 family)